MCQDRHQKFAVANCSLCEPIEKSSTLIYTTSGGGLGSLALVAGVIRGKRLNSGCVDGVGVDAGARFSQSIGLMPVQAYGDGLRFDRFDPNGFYISCCG